MAISEHFTEAAHDLPETYPTHEAGRRINMAKLMGLSILVNMAVPVLIFLAADRAFEGNWWSSRLPAGCRRVRPASQDDYVG